MSYQLEIRCPSEAPDLFAKFSHAERWFEVACLSCKRAHRAEHPDLWRVLHRYSADHGRLIQTVWQLRSGRVVTPR